MSLTTHGRRAPARGRRPRPRRPSTQHPAAQRAAGEAAVLRAALVAGLARPPTRPRGRPGTRFAGAPTAIRGTGRSSSAAPAVSRSTTSAERQHAGQRRARCRARRTRSRGRWCPSAPPRTGTSFSSRACGAWSVAMQSIVPSRRPSISAWRSASVRSGGFIFSRVSSARGTRLVGEREVVRGGLGGDPHAARLGLRDRLDRLARAQVLDVDARRPRSRRSRRRGRSSSTREIDGIPAEPEPRGDLALVHDAVAATATGPPRAARARRRTAAGTAAPCAASPARCDRLAVVGEAERAGVAQLGHLGQRLAREPARDRGEEADRDARLAPRRRRAASAGPARSRPSGRCSASRRRRRSRRPRRRACRSRGPPCAPGRACAGARAGRRSPGTGGGPRRRATSAPSGASSVPGSPSSAISPSRTSTSCGRVDARARVEHVRAADRAASAGACGGSGGRRRSCELRGRRGRVGRRSGAPRPASSS